MVNIMATVDKCHCQAMTMTPACIKMWTLTKYYGYANPKNHGQKKLNNKSSTNHKAYRNYKK